MLRHHRPGRGRPSGPAAALPALLAAALGTGALLPAAAHPAAHPTVVRAVAAGGLPQPPSPRRAGLPVALAVVALAGSASLLVRTLLAEPPAPPNPRPTVPTQPGR